MSKNERPPRTASPKSAKASKPNSAKVVRSTKVRVGFFDGFVVEGESSTPVKCSMVLGRVEGKAIAMIEDQIFHVGEMPPELAGKVPVRPLLLAPLLTEGAQELLLNWDTLIEGRYCCACPATEDSTPKGRVVRLRHPLFNRIVLCDRHRKKLPELPLFVEEFLSKMAVAVIRGNLSLLEQDPSALGMQCSSLLADDLVVWADEVTEIDRRLKGLCLACGRPIGDEIDSSRAGRPKEKFCSTEHRKLYEKKKIRSELKKASIAAKFSRAKKSPQ